MKLSCCRRFSISASSPFSICRKARFEDEVGCRKFCLSVGPLKTGASKTAITLRGLVSFSEAIAELGGEVLPRGQAGARFEHAAFDRRRNSVSNLLGERLLGGAVDVQVQGHRHRSTLIFRVLGAFFPA
jgi:hypothetical protein